MDLLLINPRSKVGKIPLGLLSIAAYVRKHGFDVKIINGDTQNVEKELLAERVPAVIGITATTDVVLEAYKICEFAKKRISKDVCCVIGGFHATALPKRTLRESKFDIAVVGEGEQTILEIVRTVKQRKPPINILGTVVKAHGKIICNPPRELIKNLDNLPFPAYDLIDMSAYFHMIRGEFGNTKRTMIMLVTRGCPFNCVFCASKKMWRRQLRFFSIDYIIRQLRFLIQKYKIDGVSFLDDELFMNKDFVHKLCDALITTGLAKQLKWSCQGRVDTIDKKLIRKLKAAGCVLIRFGMESGSQKVLNFLKRHTTTPEQNKKAAKLCKEEGIACFGSFIIGSPAEDVNDIIETINFISTSMLTNADVFVLVPYPGTDAWEIYKTKGLLRKDINWSNFIVEGVDTEPIIRTEHFSSKQLLNIKNYISIHVTAAINSGKKPKPLNHKKELEKILAGDVRMAKHSAGHKLMKLLMLGQRAARNPKKAMKYLFKRFLLPRL